jgi:hypothetical protein
MSEQKTDLTEAIKVGFEAAKQLTTLSAGSIVVIGTFLSNIFPADKQGILEVPWYIKGLIAGAFILFGASLLNSTAAIVIYRHTMGDYLDSIRKGTETDFFEGTDFFEERFILHRPLYYFAGGVVCFGVAVLLNLFFGS